MLIAHGVPAFCPHAGGIFPSAYDVPYEQWIAYDLAVLARCTHLILLPYWEQSSGARRERDRALELGLPVWEWQDGAPAPDWLAGVDIGFGVL